MPRKEIKRKSLVITWFFGLLFIYCFAVLYIFKCTLRDCISQISCLCFYWRQCFLNAFTLDNECFICWHFLGGMKRCNGVCVCLCASLLQFQTMTMCTETTRSPPQCCQEVLVGRRTSPWISKCVCTCAPARLQLSNSPSSPRYPNKPSFRPGSKQIKTNIQTKNNNLPNDEHMSRVRAERAQTVTPQDAHVCCSSSPPYRQYISIYLYI